MRIIQGMRMLVHAYVGSFTQKLGTEIFLYKSNAIYSMYVQVCTGV